MKVLLEKRPNQKVIYFADTANVPYGNKSSEEIIRYTLENSRFLMDQKIDLLVIACFTASVHALKTLQESLSIPVMGMIPSALNAISFSKGKMALLGTKATIESKVVEHLIQKRYPEIELFPVACPEFVPLIESGIIEGALLEEVASRYLKDLPSLDAAFLACTHYPWILPVLEKTLGKSCQIIDPTLSCAEEIAKKRVAFSSFFSTDSQFFTTAHPIQFQKIASDLLGYPIPKVLSV